MANNSNNSNNNSGNTFSYSNKEFGSSGNLLMTMDPDIDQSQSDEIECLKSIYRDEFVELPIEGVCKRFKITLIPHPTGQYQNYCAVKLNVKYSPNYPKTLPSIDLEKVRGLSDELIDELSILLSQKMIPGEIIVFELCQAIQDFLLLYNKETVSLHQEMIKRLNTSNNTIRDSDESKSSENNNDDDDDEDDDDHHHGYSDEDNNGIIGDYNRNQQKDNSSGDENDKYYNGGSIGSSINKITNSIEHAHSLYRGSKTPSSPTLPHNFSFDSLNGLDSDSIFEESSSSHTPPLKGSSSIDFEDINSGSSGNINSSSGSGTNFIKGIKDSIDSNSSGNSNNSNSSNNNNNNNNNSNKNKNNYNQYPHPHYQQNNNNHHYDLIDSNIPRIKWKQGGCLSKKQNYSTHKGVNEENGKGLICKIIDLSINGKANEINQDDIDFIELKKGLASKVNLIQREIETMKYLNNPFIIKYIGTNFDQNSLYIFQDLVPSGQSLKQKLIANGVGFEESVVKKLTYQLLLGLLYLHSQHIPHREFKSHNIIYDGSNSKMLLSNYGGKNLKIFDHFDRINGSLKNLNGWAFKSQQHLFSNNGNGGVSSGGGDSFSSRREDLINLGIVVLEMLCGSVLINNSTVNNYLNQLKLLNNQSQNQHIPPPPLQYQLQQQYDLIKEIEQKTHPSSPISTSAKDFLSLCFTINSNDQNDKSINRLEAGILLKHPFLSPTNTTPPPNFLNFTNNFKFLDKATTTTNDNQKEIKPTNKIESPIIESLIKSPPSPLPSPKDLIVTSSPPPLPSTPVSNKNLAQQQQQPPPLPPPSPVISKLLPNIATAQQQAGYNDMFRYHSRYRTDFEEIEMIGKGGFGVVVKSKNKLDGRYYAIKKIKTKGYTDSDQEPLTNKLLREVTTLSRLHHQFVVRYYQAWIEKSDVTHDLNDENEDLSGDLETDASEDWFMQSSLNSRSIVSRDSYSGISLSSSNNNISISGAGNKSSISISGTKLKNNNNNKNISKSTSSNDKSKLLISSGSSSTSSNLPAIKKTTKKNSIPSTPKKLIKKKSLVGSGKNKKLNNLIGYNDGGENSGDSDSGSGGSSGSGSGGNKSKIIARSGSYSDSYQIESDICSDQSESDASISESDYDDEDGKSIVVSGSDESVSEGDDDDEEEEDDDNQDEEESGDNDSNFSGESFDDEEDDEEDDNDYDTYNFEEKSKIISNHSKLSMGSSNRSRNRIKQPPKDSHTLYIQMEYCSKKTLKTLIDNVGGIPEEEAFRLLRQIVEGLNHIHGQQIIHRDLKPANIFIDNEQNVKIGDFGLATSGGGKPDDLNSSTGGTATGGGNQFSMNLSSSTSSTGNNNNNNNNASPNWDINDENISMTGGVGTPFYCCPEILEKNTKHYGTKVDMYSLGIIFFEMCFQFQTQMERSNILRDLRDNLKFPPGFESTKPDQASIIRSLLSRDPNERPSTKQLLDSGLLPSKMEDDILKEAIKTIANPTISLFSYLMEKLFGLSSDEHITSRYLYTNNPLLTPMHLICRERTFSRLENIFRNHGALKIETPTFFPKDSSNLPNNGANVAKFLDEGGTVVHLPYDLTVPWARHVVIHGIQQSKRFSFSRVYRRSAPGFSPKELYECDFDIVGPPKSRYVSDAETIRIMVEIMEEFKDEIGQKVNYKIRVNHYSLLDGVLAQCGVEKRFYPHVYITVSQLNWKLNWAQVATTLKEYGLSPGVVSNLSAFFRQKGDLNACVNQLESLLVNHKESISAITDLKALVRNLQMINIIPKVSLDLSLVHNYQYYDGIVFQAYIERPTPSNPMKSEIIMAGGRYDKLIRSLHPNPSTSGNVCGVGVTIASEKIVNTVLTYQQNLLNNSKLPLSKQFQSHIEVFVCSLGSSMLTEKLQVCSQLWAMDIRVDYSLIDYSSTEDIYSHCRQNGISWVVLLKEKLFQNGSLKVRHIESRTENTVSRKDFVDHILKSKRYKINENHLSKNLINNSSTNEQHQHQQQQQQQQQSHSHHHHHHHHHPGNQNNQTSISSPNSSGQQHHVHFSNTRSIIGSSGGITKENSSSNLTNSNNSVSSSGSNSNNSSSSTNNSNSGNTSSTNTVNISIGNSPHQTHHYYPPNSYNSNDDQIDSFNIQLVIQSSDEIKKPKLESLIQSQLSRLFRGFVQTKATTIRIIAVDLPFTLIKDLTITETHDNISRFPRANKEKLLQLKLQVLKWKVYPFIIIYSIKDDKALIFNI